MSTTPEPTAVTSSGNEQHEEMSTNSMRATAGTKRSLPEDPSMSEDEVKRLRDKNRTNSKRFRDRKKSYMDGLFEEKYRLGKSNNDLRDDNEKLRLLLKEATLENQRHKRNAALGLYSLPSNRIPPPPTNAPSLLAMPHVPALASRPSPLADVVRLQHNARMEEELFALRKAPLLSTTASLWSMSRPSPTVLDLLDEVEVRKREQIRQDLALRDLEASMAARLMTTHSHPSVGVSSYHRRYL